MQLNIYHTNDIHSNYAFLKKVHAYLQLHRREEDFYFDSGDFTDLKSLIVEADMGLSAMQLLMTCRPDAIAVGNNEIDLTNEHLSALREYPLLSANLTANDGSPVQGLQPAMLLERCGRRFLIIGAAPYYDARLNPNKYNLFFEMGNLRTTDPIPAIQSVLSQYAGQYDFVILLSHCGHLVDAFLEKQFPQINLWLEGHSHAIITDSNHSQSGKGETLGRVTLEITDDAIRVAESVQIELPVSEDPVFDCCLSQAEVHADEVLSTPLPCIGELPFEPYRESPLINFVCDCLHKHFGGDFALMHSGIAEHGMEIPVSRKSLLEIFPSKLNPTVYRLAGREILKAIEQSLDDDFIHQSGQGPGFRGSLLGTLGFSSNVSLTREPFAAAVNGVPIAPEQQYTIVTDDYLQRGTGYSSLQVPDDAAKFDVWFIRDLVQHYLMDAELFRTARIPRERGNSNGI